MLFRSTSVGTPAQLAAWRLGMAHIAPFVGALAPAQRADLCRAADAAVGAGPLQVSMLVVTAE